ncbi:helix-turn-helix transcriptional regulator [Halosolutus amylolyticus]|uniref:Helix-turn-helix transcriptional regulator n=1 Tax=Halosolutus amylolyticus TaxID=2932267 RepID=A0ABD5PKV2_9EURY|nr:hypothetical protein [Halosolutus amylolyticus]
MDGKGQWALLCVLVVVGFAIALVPIASPVAGADAGGATPAIQEDPSESGELADADEIHIDVQIRENGSATFTVEYRYALDDENMSDEEWDEMRTDIEENADAYAATEEERWNQTLADGENRTDRDMNLSNVSVSTDESTVLRDRETGQVTFTFEWSKFARVELNRIEAGDAISGFMLPDDTTLQFRWPDEYELYDEPDPSPTGSNDGSISWDGGETEFASEQPRVVLMANGTDGSNESGEDPNETGGNQETSDGEPAATGDGPSMPWLAVAGALLLLASVGAAGWWIRDRQVRTQSSASEPSPASEGTADTGGSDGVDGPPPELLSNEERVLRLLEERGGRIKQQEVVSELDWTEAKTSQVVSGLREDDEIEVFRIGRENVLSLPTEDETPS